MKYTKEEINLIRQWFNCILDVNPKFLEKKDYKLAKKIYDDIGMKMPDSLNEKFRDD